MKKVLSIILYVLAIASIILLVLEPNAETFGIPQSFITTGLLAIAAVKEIIQQTQMLSIDDAVDLANSASATSQQLRKANRFTSKDIKHWKETGYLD